jgi:hypothetical protein
MQEQKPGGVAAGVPPGGKTPERSVTIQDFRVSQNLSVYSGRQDAALYVRRDARRYEFFEQPRLHNLFTAAESTAFRL